MMDELNNVVVQQQLVPQPSQLVKDQEEYRSPYSALPVHMRQMQGLNQSQPNIWNGGKQIDQQQLGTLRTANGQILSRSYAPPEPPRGVQQRAASQPQLNGSAFDRSGSQQLLDQIENRNSIANMDVVTDSDDGGFASRTTRRPQTMYQITQQTQLTGSQQAQQQQQRNSPQVFQNGNQSHNNVPYGQQQQQQPQQTYASPYQHTHMTGQQYGSSINSQQTPLIHGAPQQQIFGESPYNATPATKNDPSKSSQHEYAVNSLIQARQEAQRASFQKRLLENQQQHQQQQRQTPISPHLHSTPVNGQKPPTVQRMDLRTGQDIGKQVPGSANSSDYDKSGNQSSNVDSGRGSAAYSSGRKAQLDTESSDSPIRVGLNGKNDESDWVDIVDAELRHILEPGIQGLSIRPESTVSGSVSSMSPPLPPLSPDGSSYKPSKSTKETDRSKQEYGTDSYNRPGRTSGPIGPSRAGWQGSSLHKQAHGRSSGKKHEQAMLKRHRECNI